jgi:DNA-binding response OmpR family regulator
MTSENTTPLTVLVADDEPAMLSLISRYMKSLGFSVIEASEGDSAWELAQNESPDLVILDVMMPGMSGWEICKRLKAQSTNGGRFSETGVIMLTGIGENLNEMTSPLFAADAWLNKPFDFSDLDERIRDTLARYSKPMPARGAPPLVEDAPPDSGWDIEVPSEPPRPRLGDESAAAAPPHRAASRPKRATRAATAKVKAKPAKAKRVKAKPVKATKKPAKKAAKKPARRPAKKAAAKGRTVRAAARSAAKKKPSKASARKVASRKR